MEGRFIEFAPIAYKQFRAAIEYIAEDSVQNAEKVRLAIIEKLKAVSKNPEIHPPDKFKLNNTGAYRAFELYRLRVSYFIATDRIRVLRVRHTRQAPRNF